MKIASTELKKDLKQLSVVRSEYFQIGAHGIATQDPDVWVTVQNRLSELGEPFSVHGRKFSATVNRMSGEIEIAREENKLTLRSARAKVDLEIQNIKPLLFPKQEANALPFNIQEFKKVLGLVAPCVSTKRSSEFGQGVLLDTLPASLDSEFQSGYRATGSDGLILATVTTTVKIARQFRWILNSEAAAFVQLMDGNLEIGEGENGLQIKSGNSLCFLSRPNKEYPNIDKIFPASSEFVAKFRPEDWVKPLQLLEPLIEPIQTKDAHIPAIGCKFAGNMVLFTSIGTGSQAQDEATYEQLEPDPVFDPKELTLRLNAKHLSTFLSKASSEATIKVTGKDRPILFESGSLRVLTMPVGGK